MQINTWKSVFSDFSVNLAAAWLATMFIELQSAKLDMPILLFRVSSVIVCLIVANELRKEVA